MWVYALGEMIVVYQSAVQKAVLLVVLMAGYLVVKWVGMTVEK
jgi:hypothetical protein